MAKRTVNSFIILVILLAVFIVLNIVSGSADITPGNALMTLFGASGGETAREIIMTIRIPRMVAAVFLGGALAVSGFLLQTFFANPIAGPFVLGISSGAKLAVALVMITALSRGWVLNSLAMIGAAFAGAMVCMGFILLISGRVRNMSVLVICGIMIGYICSAVTEFAVTFADDSNIVNLHDWSRGSFSGISLENIKVIVPLTVLVIALVFFIAKPMGAYRMGEEYARNLGVNIKRLQLLLILFSSILAAEVTAYAGPVSFLGVASPHLVRKLFGTDRPLVMVPACFIAGGTFCLLCDLIARTLFAPTELGIGTVTAVAGAPVVIWVMLERRKVKTV